MNDDEFTEIVAFRESVEEKVLASEAEVWSKLHLLEQQAESTLAKLEVLDSFSDRIGTVKERIESFESQLREALDTTRDSIEDVSETIEAACESAVNDRLEEIVQVVDDVTSSISDEADEVCATVEAVSEDATEKIEELFSAILPDSMMKESDKLLSTLEALESNGAVEIDKLTEKLEAITGKTRELTSLIDQVRPILDLANSVL